MTRPTTPTLPQRSTTPSSIGRSIVAKFRGVFFGAQVVPPIQAASAFVQFSRPFADIVPVPGLSECLDLIDKVIQSVDKVHVERELCKGLAQKVSDFARILESHVEPLHKQAAAQNWVQSQIAATKSVLAPILADLEEWVKLKDIDLWFDRNAMADKIAAHEKAVDQCRENIIMECNLGIANGVAHMETETTTMVKTLAFVSNRLCSLEETIKTNDSDSPQFKSAQKETLELRNKLTGDSTLKIPPSLGSRCTRVGDGPVKAGSTYDVWKGELDGTFEVAMKLLRDVNAKSTAMDKTKQKACARFVRELNTMLSVENKHVVKLHGWCTINDEFYLVSEWMRYGDLGTYLGQTRCTPEEYLGLLLDILQGLSYLHSVGILHGALRPSNILINQGKYAVLSDFALSKEVSANSMNTFSNTSARQLRYQAPEVDDKTVMSIAGDVWSWAMTSLEIVSGHRPFHNLTTINALARAQGDPTKLPSLTDYKCSTFSQYPDLWSILKSCWVDAGERPAVDVLLQRVGALHSRS